MSTESNYRRDKPRAPNDERDEMLTPWLIAVALGLAALVLFGAIERNLQSREGVAAAQAPPHHADVVCRPQSGAGRAACGF